MTQSTTEMVSNQADQPTLDPSQMPRIEIGPTNGWSSLGLRDLWEYRELLLFLVAREIQGAYRQTALGVSWLFLRPILHMALLSVVFGRLVGVPSDDLPYPLFSLSALLPWGFFSNAVIRSSRSLVQNMQMISKVYFPRLVIPLAGAASGLVDLAASSIVFLIAMLIYRLPFRIEMLWLPVFVILALGFALMVGLWLATLSVQFRDVEFAVNFLLQALMYISPVIYSASIVPAQLQFIYELNPMTAVIQGFRWSIFGVGTPPGLTLVYATVIVLCGVLSGAYVFRRTERTVVDIL
ncbi:MAG: ABC transporter permease [Anaerolineales bacterium]